MQIEEVLMNTKGVNAVLTIFGKSTLEYCGMITKNDDNVKVNLGAAILVRPGINIKYELDIMYKKQRKRQLLKHLEIYKVKNFFMETYSSYSIDPRRSEISPMFLGVHNCHGFVREMEETNLCKRNVALLENRLDIFQCYFLKQKLLASQQLGFPLCFLKC